MSWGQRRYSEHDAEVYQRRLEGYYRDINASQLKDFDIAQSVHLGKADKISRFLLSLKTYPKCGQGGHTSAECRRESLSAV